MDLPEKMNSSALKSGRKRLPAELSRNTQFCHIFDTWKYIIIQEIATKYLTHAVLYGTLDARFERSSHEKANPAKAGDAKLKGLTTLVLSGVYGSQLPNSVSTAYL